MPKLSSEKEKARAVSVQKKADHIGGSCDLLNFWFVL